MLSRLIISLAMVNCFLPQRIAYSIDQIPIHWRASIPIRTGQLHEQLVRYPAKDSQDVEDDTLSNSDKKFDPVSRQKRPNSFTWV